MKALWEEHGTPSLHHGSHHPWESPWEPPWEPLWERAPWEYMGALWEYHGSTIGPPVSTITE